MKILLVVYDNDSYIHYFPQGIAYLAAVLLKEGYKVTIYNQDFHHYPDEHLTSYLDNNNFDVIGVGVIGGYYQYKKLISISKAINKSKNRPFYIIGGHGPTPEPEYFLRKTNANVVVMGEGEITIVDLLNTFSQKKSLKKVKGIAYLENNKLVINERRPVIEDIDSIPMPAYHLFPVKYYRLLRLPHCTNKSFVMSIISGRGCPFKCNFCYRMDPGFRPRSNEAMIEEIKYLKIKYNCNHILFLDELLMSSEERTIKFCEDLIKANLNINWDCSGRLNFATPEVLKIMKKAGCVFINYGIEAFDDQILKNMKKSLTTKQIVGGIKNTLAVGISPGFNIIFGNIGENRETLNKGVEFLLKHDDCEQMRTIRPVTPYPGSPLYYYAIEKGLLKDVEDFYENKHINSDLLAVNFTKLSDEEFHKVLMEANIKLINNYFNKKLNSHIAQTKELYLQKNVMFRGYRHT